MIFIVIFPPLFITLVGWFLLFGSKEAAGKFIRFISVISPNDAPARARMIGAGLFPMGITGGIMVLFGMTDIQGPFAVLFLLFLFAACATSIVLLLLWNNRRDA